MTAEVKTLQDIIKDMWSKQLIPIDMSDQADAHLVGQLCQAMADVIHKIHSQPICKKRPNEVGNAIEPFIKDSIAKLHGYTAKAATDASGRGQASGYPDILIQDNLGRYSYIECKTYNQKNLATTFRSFYLSPLKRPKVIHNARHIVISFEMQTIRGNNYVAHGFKIVDLYGLKCKLKQEWNASNRELYQQPILGEIGSAG